MRMWTSSEQFAVPFSRTNPWCGQYVGRNPRTAQCVRAAPGGFEGAKPLPPLLISQPGNQTVNAGQTATFAVTATGTGPLTYQWYVNGVPINGATSSTYTTPPTTSGQSGSVYTVTVSNSSGSVTSDRRRSPYKSYLRSPGAWCRAMQPRRITHL